VAGQAGASLENGLSSRRIDGIVNCKVFICQKAFREAGGHWSTFVVWAKNTFTLGRSDYQRQYEPILLQLEERHVSFLVWRP
jgi:hypothetical protein